VGASAACVQSQAREQYGLPAAASGLAVMRSRVTRGG